MPSRRRSRRAGSPRSGARRFGRSQGRPGRRGTARCPCAGNSSAAGASGRRLARQPQRPAADSTRAGEQVDEAPVVDVPCDGDDDVPAHVGAAVVRLQRTPGDALDHVGAADHGPAERMLTEHRLGGEVVDEIARVVVHHRDLLEHHLPLGVDVVEARPKDHVRHHVDRDLEVVVRDPRVDDSRLAGRRRVQLAAHRVEALGDLLRRVARRPLEQQVLDEVRDTRPRERLVTRPGADPEADRRRPHARRSAR